MNQAQLKELLDSNVKRYNQMGFIEMDPISIPHRYTKKQDIEIAAFWTAILSWGQRKTIINKATELFAYMDNSPYDFIVNHKEADRLAFQNFKHRTFNYDDTLYFLEFLQYHYQTNSTLEDAFLIDGQCNSVESSLSHFQDYFMSLAHAPLRTRKHIASPARKSTCKRLNMLLRWLVRKDKSNVDFGIWDRIKPNQLMIPLDVHVHRVSLSLGIVNRTQKDWKTVAELTENLRKLDPKDPIKYDYALFGMGIDA